MSRATKEEIFEDDNQGLLMFDNFNEMILEEAWHFIDGAKEECVDQVLKYTLKNCKEIYAEYV